MRAEKLESGPMQIQHGHTDTHVLVQFSRPCQNLFLTEAQLEAFIAATQNSLKMLKEHQLKRMVANTPVSHRANGQGDANG